MSLPRTLTWFNSGEKLAAFLLARSLCLYKKNFVDRRQQLVLMDKVIRELDDLKNSLTSVLKKIAQIEADNINLEVGILSDGLPDLHEEVDHGLQKVSELHEQFTEHRNKY